MEGAEEHEPGRAQNEPGGGSEETEAGPLLRRLWRPQKEVGVGPAAHLGDHLRIGRHWPPFSDRLEKAHGRPRFEET